MTDEKTDQKYFVVVTEARQPVQMTAIQTDNINERGRSPVPITPVQTQTTPTTLSNPPAATPVKKD
jgi:hypothetical protein